VLTIINAPLAGAAMFSRSSDTSQNPLIGISLACAGYSLFAIQDAVVKWLVADYSVPQILFIRSIIIVAIAGFMVRRLRHPSILKSAHRSSLILRAGLMLAAWMSFYSAARHLGLAEITTMYFSAPIIVIFLSILVLKENVGSGASGQPNRKHLEPDDGDELPLCHCLRCHVAVGLEDA
jgi:S-adenosylmethionine uptake transporter